jgi:hypothetical protein
MDYNGFYETSLFMRYWVILTSAFLLLAGLYVFPLFAVLGGTTSDPVDGLFSAWVMTWVARSMWFDPSLIFQAPIFAPLPDTTTFSDPMLTGSLLTLPFLLWTNEPLVSQTVNLFLGFWLTSLGFAMLGRAIGLGKTSALGLGLAAGFGQAYAQYTGHLQMFMIQWLPFGLACVAQWVQKPRWGWWAGWTVCFLLLGLNSPFSAVLLLFSSGTMLLFASRGKPAPTWPAWRTAFLWIFLGIFILFTFYQPYFHSEKLYQSARTIREAAHFSLSLDELLGTKRGIPLGVLLLIGAAVLLAAKQAPAGSKKLVCWRRAFLTLALCSIILSFGPVLKWGGNTIKIPFPIPLPYALAHLTIPGFQAFRVPARWMLLANFSLIVLAYLLVHQRWQRRFFIITVSVLLLEASWMKQAVPIASRENRPSVYSWLEQASPSTIAFIPPYIYDIPGGAEIEVRRMLWSLPSFHAQAPIHRLYNGYSGFAPRERVDALVTIYTKFPDEPALQLLKEGSVQFLILEKNLLPADRLQQYLVTAPTILYEDETHLITRLDSTP